MHAVRLIHAHQHKATKNFFLVYCNVSASLAIRIQDGSVLLSTVPVAEGETASSYIHSLDVPNDNREACVAVFPTLVAFPGLWIFVIPH